MASFVCRRHKHKETEEERAKRKERERRERKERERRERKEREEAEQSVSCCTVIMGYMINTKDYTRNVLSSSRFASSVYNHSYHRTP